MAGSGTTLVASRLHGHRALGFDTDPLALLIARAWASDVDPKQLRPLAARVLSTAQRRYALITQGSAYPTGADKETCAFVRFWFDPTNRRQLAALSASIASVRDAAAQAVLWCAFSRMIITKDAGVSLAMDVSHSRPHRAYKIAPVTPFVRFPLAVEQILRASHFSEGEKFPQAAVRRGDARKIPLKNRTADLVITSPPYINAIDYLRGHKLSLVWMGRSVSELRDLRSRNIGSEKFQTPSDDLQRLKTIQKGIGNLAALPMRAQRMLLQYFHDMEGVLREISRILKRNGKAVVVVGNSTIRGIYIPNSKILAGIARRHGLHLASARTRELKENRRYLPPPARRASGAAMQSRMNEEVILFFEKRPSAPKGGYQ
jgi:DNA modification methylase